MRQKGTGAGGRKQGKKMQKQLRKSEKKNGFDLPGAIRRHFQFLETIFGWGAAAFSVQIAEGGLVIGEYKIRLNCSVLGTSITRVYLLYCFCYVWGFKQRVSRTDRLSRYRRLFISTLNIYTPSIDIIASYFVAVVVSYSILCIWKLYCFHSVFFWLVKLV